MVLFGEMNPNYQLEIGLPVNNEGKKGHFWSAGCVCEHLLEQTRPMNKDNKVNGRLQQLNPGS